MPAAAHAGARQSQGGELRDGFQHHAQIELPLSRAMRTPREGHPLRPERDRRGTALLSHYGAARLRAEAHHETGAHQAARRAAVQQRAHRGRVGDVGFVPAPVPRGAHALVQAHPVVLPSETALRARHRQQHELRAVAAQEEGALPVGLQGLIHETLRTARMQLHLLGELQPPGAVHVLSGEAPSPSPSPPCPASSHAHKSTQEPTHQVIFETTGAFCFEAAAACIYDGTVFFLNMLLSFFKINF